MVPDRRVLDGRETAPWRRGKSSSASPRGGCAIVSRKEWRESVSESSHERFEAGEEADTCENRGRTLLLLRNERSLRGGAAAARAWDRKQSAASDVARDVVLDGDGRQTRSGRETRQSLGNLHVVGRTARRKEKNSRNHEEGLATDAHTTPVRLENHVIIASIDLAGG